MSTFALPLFPLRTVLFPAGVLPLRIFEVRYLDLMQRCQKENAPFGVVCLKEGQEVRQPPGPGQPSAETFHDTGTLAHIELCERPQPGLMLVRCLGGQRFRLLRREQMKHGLWCGEAELLPQDPALAVPPDLAPVRLGLQRLHLQLQMQAQTATKLTLHPPLLWDDCGWLAHRWCEILPVSSQLKQQFLAVDNPLIRLELLDDLLTPLQIGRP